MRYSSGRGDFFFLKASFSERKTVVQKWCNFSHVLARFYTLLANFDGEKFTKEKPRKLLTYRAY